MGFQTSFDSLDVPIVLDASGAINLMATMIAARVIEAIPNRFIVSDVVVDEIKSGRNRGRDDGVTLLGLIDTGYIEVQSLNERAEEIFEELVVGEAIETLDDGEAATMALAMANDFAALIDERKAIRIASERFPALRIGSTVDLLSHTQLVAAIGSSELSDAVVNALKLARMNVLPHRHQWVVELIGSERAAECPSLPRSIREPRK